nr:ribonuclease H-like domain-containing protein [Tanacetum cinerariifolium]
WSLDELVYGALLEGPYQTNLPSPDDIILYIREDRKGQVTRIRHQEEVEGPRVQILLLLLGLSYAVQQICLYMHDMREPHLAALKRILRYVQGTLDLGLYLYASSTTSLGTLDLGLYLYASSTTSLVGYTDVDWAGCPSTHRSTSGYYVFLGDNLWSAKWYTLSRSSAEAEYRSVANVVTETVWLCNLLHELHSSLSTATLVYYDNVSAVYMFANPVQRQRTKHIKIDIHFVRDMVTAGQVRVLHVPSRF